MPVRALGSRIRIGVDTGGTFTDVVTVDEETGEIRATKVPSTPMDPSRAFLAAVRMITAESTEGGGWGLPRGMAAAGEGVRSICHGTTVATNQLLEERIDDLGFITTEGFEFILEIARQSVPDGYGNSYFWVKPPRIVPVHRVKTVGGRLDHRGEVVRPFDEEQAVRAARWMRDQGITAIGVCFLHSYANPVHEHRMREVIEREHPEAAVSISSEVLREYREYERSVTTLVDAAVKPVLRRYLGRIAAEIHEPLYVMKSNGGVLSAPEVVKQPITTVLSGPAAGALGASMIAPEAITLDGGGTSTDVAVVQGGEPSLTTEGSVGRFPSKIPMIDIVTVGAGGGSIAWISPEGGLKVGPRSAGADPGPMSYPDGGEEPTVTDAHVMLGRIPPRLLGGEIRLDAEAARKGITALAGRLGLTPERAATGVLEISAWNQANAIRRITVARGLDVRDFPLVAFGGSGPLLACRLIDILGLARAIVPRDPGNLSAFGLLTVDVRNDYVQTVRSGLTASLDGLFTDLEAQARETLGREGFGGDEQRCLRSADLRYHGQAYEVRVPAPDGPVDEAFRAEVARRFHDAHERLYGYCYREREPEWVNVRMTGVGPIERPGLPRVPAGTGARSVAVRDVFFDDWRATPIYWRDALGAGDTVTGPAVIEEFGSTVPVHPGFAARVDEVGGVVIVRG